VGFKLVADGLEWCAAEREASAADGYELAGVPRIVLKLV
jgi:hypothetical protein